MSPDPAFPLGIVAGVDEAGLGPLLGPLTLGMSAFRMPPGQVEADLWQCLAPAVCAQRPKDERLWMADSKVVYDRSPRGMARLESTALASLAQLSAFGQAPQDAGSLLSAGPPGFPSDRARLAGHPWYASLPQSLPVAVDGELLSRQAARLGEVLRRQGIELVDAGLRLAPAQELNESFDATGSKARTAWEQTARALAALWRDHGESGVLAWVDRQGARKRYGPLVGELCPGARVQILQETGTDCRYRLSDGKRRMELRFAVAAEELALPVALASCLAKYGRELAMHAFNDYFHGLAPELELRPTAGYVVDARRWLADAGALLDRTELPPRCLVRER